PSAPRHVDLAPYCGLHVAPAPGLADAILDWRLPLYAVVRRRAPFNLSVVAAGTLPSAPYEVLKLPRVGELLAAARQAYDFIVLDTPPLVSVPDCRVIEKWVDGFLIVVGAHKTPRKLLEGAVNVTEAAKVIGRVFNGDDHPLSGYPYRYGYHYGYGRTANGNTRGWKFLRRGKSAAHT